MGIKLKQVSKRVGAEMHIYETDLELDTKPIWNLKKVVSTSYSEPHSVAKLP